MHSQKKIASFNLSATPVRPPKIKVNELDDITECLKKPKISKNAANIIKQKHTALYKWLYDFISKKPGQDSPEELVYESIRFEKLCPDLVEALMPVLTQMYQHFQKSKTGFNKEKFASVTSEQMNH